MNSGKAKCALAALMLMGSCVAQAAQGLYWRNTVTGENYQHQLVQGQVRSQGDLPKVTAPWSLVGSGDFNADGEDDLFWRNQTTGETAIQWMKQGQHQYFGDFIRAADLNWQVAAVGDLNGDRIDDLVWQYKTSGQLYLWLMGPTALKWEAPLFTVADPNWQLRFARDFDGDGKADLLFRNKTTGGNYLFLMDTATVRQQQDVQAVKDLNWQLVAAADLNGDKKTDLLWRNQTTGENYGFYMNGARVISEVALPKVADVRWQVRALTDLNGDGKADLLWWHSQSYQVVEWLMDGPTKLAESLLFTVVKDWQLQFARAIQPAYLGEPAAVPGRIEAEYYDRDGAGYSFSDSDNQNQGNAKLRSDGVDIETTTDTGGGLNVGYIANGEWLKYTVKVAKTANYKLIARVVGGEGSGQLHLEQQGENLTGPVKLNSPDWQTWINVTSPAFKLTAGVQELKLVFDAGLFNLNYIELVETTDTSTTPMQLSSPSGFSAKREGAAMLVSWQPVAHATSYLLERRNTEETTWTAFNLTTTSYVDNALVMGQNYQYRVQAQAAGYSAEVSAPVEVLWRGEVQAGATVYADRCAGCHGVDGSGGSENKPLDFNSCSVCSNLPALTELIQRSMPKNGVGSCDLKCAQDAATFISVKLLWGTNAPWNLEIISQARPKAYPGLAYDYRMAVIGGVFPYRFSLTSAPTGMSISKTGLISWTPTVEGKFDVSVKVEDSQAKTVTKAFSIQVTKTGFYFIAPTGVDTAANTGSISLPWKSLGYAFTKSLTNDSVLYLRAGNYKQASLKLNDSTPVQLLAYPGEKPVIDLDASNWVFDGSKSIARFEGLELFNMKQYGIWTENNMAGMVVRNCVFRDGFENPNILSENPAFIHAAGANSIKAYHKYFVIQDNTFKNFRLTAMDSQGRTSQTSGAVVYFDVWYSVFEDNVLTNIQNQGIVDKDDSYKNTYRKNYITGTDYAAIDIIGQYGAHQINVHNNLIENANIKVGSHGHAITNIYVHHNTLVNGSITLSWGVVSPDSHSISLDHNIVSYELSNKIIPAIVGNLNTSGTWYLGPMKGHFSSDYNLLFSNSPYLFGADPSQGARIDEYNFAQLKEQQLELHSINSKAGIVGLGTTLGIPSSSPFYGVYGHQY